MIRKRNTIEFDLAASESESLGVRLILETVSAITPAIVKPSLYLDGFIVGLQIEENLHIKQALPQFTIDRSQEVEGQ